MEINKVIAVFDEFRLKHVETALIEHGIAGFTLHPVRGRGRYFDSFNEHHLIKHIQMEMYVNSDQASAIAKVIVDAAHTDSAGEGLVSIVPVYELYWIHDKRRATEEDFLYREVEYD